MDSVSKPYRVRVYDNFHHMDEQESFVAGEFPTYEEALAEARRIVERSCLEYSYRLSIYRGFGEDPAIEGPYLPAPTFSAWEYARDLCEKHAGEPEQ